MAEPGAMALISAYLVLVSILGVLAGRRGRGDVADFVAGERSFGPVVLYFVMGATLFSAYALLGTPQRIVSKGSDVFYVLAYGSVGLVPLFFVGARVRRLGARLGFVTQAEMMAARFDSRAVAWMMGVGTLFAFLPYLVIQLKAAEIVMQWATGWDTPMVGSAIVGGVVCFYVVRGGVRGVGWTNVVQGIAMLLVVWTVGLWVPHKLYGGVGPMFDRVLSSHPEYLTLPGPGPTSFGQYSSEILVSLLGFSVWPHVFMKCFTAKSARLVQWSVVAYPSFLFFMLPLIFLGYVAVIEGGPADERVLLWLLELPEVRDAGGLANFVAPAMGFAVLAASMSTLDALLHAGGSVFVRDIGVRAAGREWSDAQQARYIKRSIVGLAIVAWLALRFSGDISVVDLLLIGYDFIVQFVPVIFVGLAWRRANRVGALWGLGSGLALVVLLHLWALLSPESYSAFNPANLRPGVWALGLNFSLLVLASRFKAQDCPDAVDDFFPPS